MAASTVTVDVKNDLMKRIFKYKALYLMLLPAVVFLIIFSYIPMYGATIAFKDFWIKKGILGSPWVGFAHFEKLFETDKFWQVFRNTIEINLLRLIFGFPAPIVLAILLNEVRHKLFKRSIQTIVYLPHFISWVTISGIIFSILSNEGLVNTIIRAFGGENVNFLTSNSMFRPLLILSGIWKEIGWGTIIYLAALSGINPDLYEAATVDGANRFKQITHITLPSMVPIISILLILNFGSMMNGGFDQVFNLYNTMVYDSGDVIDTYVYRIGLTQGKYSVATAIGLFLNVINFVLLVMVNSIAKKLSGQGIY
ncbi:protein lplB [Paenibacillus baekrokdamisoli]|uniref:Protein lplB n=1 Tax=Paenibacillus baekrokdamisoli TaxID=1712516 RepID=A0A3G9IVU4_9BACL|nr:ABC transporter permease subunit [Paenibacillus baekrokdamisoli]MBB3072546.1 putative aldouronate transport system permease protein [Paenibacillus baekrokdamisoli]BBH22402.1 protein lplB [Paenibacillus baekrokdamisoli]